LPEPDVIEVSCDCAFRFRVSAKHAGRRVKCPACAAVVTVPAPAAFPDGIVSTTKGGAADPPPPPVATQSTSPQPAAPQASPGSAAAKVDAVDVSAATYIQGLKLIVASLHRIEKFLDTISMFVQLTLGFLILFLILFLLRSCLPVEVSSQIKNRF
jgi:hypothetical protein